MRGVDWLDDLLGASDYVVISAPHTPETEKLFHAEKFAKMKSTSVLINIGRGVIVDLADLTAALRTGGDCGERPLTSMRLSRFLRTTPCGDSRT